MARDLELAEEVRRGQGPPTLRIYQWDQPAISLGRRQPPLGDLPAEILSRGLPWIRRPTGGGAVLHTTDELTYALALPLPISSADRSRTVRPELVEGRTGFVVRQAHHERAFWDRVPIRDLPGAFHGTLRDQLINEGIFAPENLTIAEGNCRGSFTLCFSAPVRGDLLYRGRKAAGSALRAWKDGVLIQGSIQGLPLEYNQLLSALSCAMKGASTDEKSIPLR